MLGARNLAVRASGAALVVLLAACGTPRGSHEEVRRAPPEPAPPAPAPGPKFHEVRAGETAWRISRRYGTSVEALLRANALQNPRNLQPGQRLRVPGGGLRMREPDRRATTYTGRDARGTSGAVRFAWPVQGKLSSGFGRRGRRHHDGLDILAPPGCAVRAAESGRVVHSGNGRRGYGNMIVVKHAGRYSSVYAHNRRNLVRAGDFVEKGQVIAEVGRTGRASTSHLHFEILLDGSPRDPTGLLP